MRIDGRIRLSHFVAESSDQFRYGGIGAGAKPLGPNAAEGLVLLPERQQLFRVKEGVLESRQPVFQPVAAIECRAHLLYSVGFARALRLEPIAVNTSLSVRKADGESFH